MPIPIFIPIGLAAIGGGIIGALARQPEVNRLKKQVRLLQNEVDRLHGIISGQMREISELYIRYKALKGLRFSERAAQKKNIKGHLLHLYSYKEYIELLCFQAKGNELNNSQKGFFNAYELMLDGNDIPMENYLSIKNYISEKYAYEIKNQIPYDQNRTIKMLEDVNV